AWLAIYRRYKPDTQFCRPPSVTLTPGKMREEGRRGGGDRERSSGLTAGGEVEDQLQPHEGEFSSLEASLIPLP
ncbi:hypothetical protein KUCAC02_032743, partial [Chaenocephalus aceratus]